MMIRVPAVQQDWREIRTHSACLSASITSRYCIHVLYTPRIARRTCHVVKPMQENDLLLLYDQKSSIQQLRELGVNEQAHPETLTQGRATF
jgi:hypothetical protein|eukprot:COSAG01_NODE_3205_length_6421_cov_8.975008_3_plen_91_part_00